MSKHTPGPWRPYPGVVVADSLIGTNCTDADIAAYGAPLVCESIRTDANARLIAAAPDLLEALQSLVAMDDAGMGVDGWEQRFNAARAAIAKAEGA